MKYFNDDDMMKYKKKTKRKPVAKADHKHIFEEVLIESNLGSRTSLSLGERCRICGKTRYKSMFLSEKNEETGVYRLLHDDEILKRYGNLPRVKENKFGEFEDIPGEHYSEISTNEKDDMLD